MNFNADTCTSPRLDLGKKRPGPGKDSPGPGKDSPGHLIPRSKLDLK